MLKKFNVEDEDVFKTCIIATMSSGKSTFINSIIGDEILPEKNEACTARTMAVIDKDYAEGIKAYIIRKNGGQEIINITNRQILSEINNDEDITDFLIETDIEGIKNLSKALVLIDTPGVNNSADERHGKRTEEFLKGIKDGLIIYLLNATQLATNDDALLLYMVSEHLKKNPGIKIFFVINKIDLLDEETESIYDIVNTAKEYIENHGIRNPIIYPVSALSAKILRMALYHREMTRREMRMLEEVYENYKPSENNMLAYAVINDASKDIYKIGDYEVTGQELSRAIDNTGITVIEKKIEFYMSEVEDKYIPEIVIKTSFDENIIEDFQERINNLCVLSETVNVKKYSDLKVKMKLPAASCGVSARDSLRSSLVCCAASCGELNPLWD